MKGSSTRDVKRAQSKEWGSKNRKDDAKHHKINMKGARQPLAVLNQSTEDAIKELRTSKDLKKFSNVDELMKDLMDDSND